MGSLAMARGGAVRVVVAPEATAAREDEATSARGGPIAAA